MWTRESGNVSSGQVILNDIAIEAARRATTMASHPKVGLFE